MNEFLEQFLIESRDLVQQATEDLLALEASPADKDLIDGIFRGVHTLKGAAGIVDFPAMGQLMHAAEDVLATVRAGTRAVSAELIGDCLGCLDQVVRWLDAIEASGELPSGSDAVAAALPARFSPAMAAQAPDGSPAWLEPFLTRQATHAGRARVALRYRPDADCFFRGVDPFERVCGLPGLLAQELVAAEPWAPLETLDPYACNLVFTALLAAGPETVAAVLGAASGQVEVWPLPPADLTAEAVTVLREQMLLASEASAEGFPGRLGAAGLVANNVLRRAGRIADARAVEEAVARSQRDGTAAAFLAVLRPLVAAHGTPRATDAPPSARSATPDAVARPPEQATPVRSPDGSPQREEPRPAAVASLSPVTPDGLPARDPGAERREDSDRAGSVEPDLAEPGDVAASVPSEFAPSASGAVRALRVGVDRIDALMALTGELTVAKNAIGHVARLAQDGRDPESLAHMLKERHSLLDRLVSDLQRAVLGIRVLPLRQVFQRFPRLVREMARDLGKSVRLVTEGESTEADKATVEALFEPLLHVLRNALDHGVEPEAERLAMGKPAVAELRLRAVRDGDLVIVEVTDDGRGIDTAKVRGVAAQLGIASPEALAEMSDAAAADLIFTPGFSTSSTVTDLSGRGVGMDVVRSAIGGIGGRASVSSERGRGTTVRFTLPFTVMMIQVMTVEVGGQIFGIPIDNVVETVSIPRDRISRLGAAEAFVLRDRTVSLVRLSETLASFDDGPSTPARAERSEARAVVVTFADQMGAIEVDGFGERMDVMLKPMEGLLAGMGDFAGTTVLGDGRVLIVLDLQELLRCPDDARSLNPARSLEASRSGAPP